MLCRGLRGGASVLLAKRPSEVEVYNDLNGELVNFFRVLRDTPEPFKATWKYTLISREEFYRLRDADLSAMDPIERAHRFLYINRAGFGGQMQNGTPFGISATMPSALTVWLDRLPDWADALHSRLQDSYIENLPCCELIERWDKSKPGNLGTVFFCDPPYVDTAGYTAGKFGDEHHRQLRDTLGAIKGRFLLTINDHPLVRELYDGCYLQERMKQYSIAKDADARHAYAELIIANYPFPKAQQATLF